MGKPVIASRFADAVKLTKNGELGYLYTPHNLDDLITTAARAYNERGKLADMGAAARAEILANHTWSSRIRDFIAAADEIRPSSSSAR